MEQDKVEQLILKALMAPVKAADGRAFVEMIEGLSETDETQRLREVVFHMDRLIEMGYVVLNNAFATEGYTDEHGNVSINYLNSAVMIYPERLEVTEMGKVHASKKRTPSEKVIDRPAFAALTYVVTFLLGMATMYVMLTLFK